MAPARDLKQLRVSFTVTRSWLSGPGYQILACRSWPADPWLPDPDYQILDNRSWLLNLGHQILAARSRLSDPGYQILDTRSWIPDPGYQILATRFWRAKSWIPDPRAKVVSTQSWSHFGVPNIDFPWILYSMIYQSKFCQNHGFYNIFKTKRLWL